MTIAGAPADRATPVLDTRTGDTVAGLADGITAVYAEVFSAAPWHEPPDAAVRFRDRLAVRPTARRYGLGRRLLAAITEPAPQGRAWLLTARHATGTVAFYRRADWHEVPTLPAVPAAVTVFLAPHHPHAPDI